nr:VirE2 family protein [Agrobacterium fabrum]
MQRGVLGEATDKYSRDFVRPEPASRPISDSRRIYESRPRSQSVNSF